MATVHASHSESRSRPDKRNPTLDGAVRVFARDASVPGTVRVESGGEQEYYQKVARSVVESCLRGPAGEGGRA